MVYTDNAIAILFHPRYRCRSNEDDRGKEEEMGIVILTNATSELSNKGIAKFMRAYYEVDQPIQVTTAMVPAL